MSEVRYGPFADRLFGRHVSRIVGGLAIAEEEPTTGELAGTCDLAFGHGSSTLLGAGDLFITPGGGDSVRITFGQLNLYMDASLALAGTTALLFDSTATGDLTGAGGALLGSIDLVFTVEGTLASEQAFETPIVIMARSPA